MGSSLSLIMILSARGGGHVMSCFQQINLKSSERICQEMLTMGRWAAQETLLMFQIRGAFTSSKVIIIFFVSGNAKYLRPSH